MAHDFLKAVIEFVADLKVLVFEVALLVVLVIEAVKFVQFMSK